MKTEHDMMTESGTDEFRLTRTFNAPRELVWKAFTEEEHLLRWWGPKEWKMLAGKLDLRPGGSFHYGMEANGHEMWGKFVYREISAPERIVFVNSFSDREGNITRAPFGDTIPLEILNIWTFEERDGKTLLTLRGRPINASEEEHATYNGMHASMQQGFGGTLDQLEEYLATI